MACEKLGILSIYDDHDDHHIYAVDAEGKQLMFAEIGAGNRYDESVWDFSQR